MSGASYDDIYTHLSELNEQGDEILLADGFEDALVGTVEGWFGNERRTVALYDTRRCLEILEASGLEPGDAEEFFGYNVTGAYAGPGTPVFGLFFRPVEVAAPG